MSSNTWRLPFSGSARLAAPAGTLTFVGGAGDFDPDGRIRNPGDVQAQLVGAIENAAAALAIEGCTLADVVRVKLFYRHNEPTDRWRLMADLLKRLPADPSPAVTTVPVVMQPWAAQELQIQIIAKRGWRVDDDVQVVERPAPEEVRARFASGRITAGLRAGEFIAVPGRPASDLARCALDGVKQTTEVMEQLGAVLAGLGASFSDAVKMEGYYCGADLGQWAELAAVRRSYFPEPGPVGTVVPWHASAPEGVMTQVELLAMREEWNGFGKYIPRMDSWPKRVWDWPMPTPYRQGIKLRDAIWLGGQVPFAPGKNKGATVLDGQLLPQTQFVMTYIDDILHGFGAKLSDLSLLVCYFASDGSPDLTGRFLEVLADSVGGVLPPVTLVPKPQLQSPEMTVEIWGVARS